MYISLACTLLSFIPTILKMHTNGFKTHLVINLAFEVIILTAQFLGFGYRYQPSAGLLTAIKCITTFLSLWHRLSLINMLSLILPNLKRAGMWLQVVSVGFHFATASPLYLSDFVTVNSSVNTVLILVVFVRYLNMGILYLYLRMLCRPICRNRALQKYIISQLVQ